MYRPRVCQYWFMPSQAALRLLSKVGDNLARQDLRSSHLFMCSYKMMMKWKGSLAELQKSIFLHGAETSLFTQTYFYMDIFVVISVKFCNSEVCVGIKVAPGVDAA